MKKLTIILFGLMMVFTVAVNARATSFTLDAINVSLNTADPGLVLYWSQIQPTPVTFDLANVGDSVTTNVFKIGTHETWSNPDDQVAKSISASFVFSDPSVTAVDTGTTAGHVFLFLDWGSVEWNDPVYYGFGNGGEFSIDLSDETFWTPGCANITATMTLTKAETAPVPEPSTLLLLGAGLLGLGYYGRKRAKCA